MQTNELHATDTAANDADGRHIRKVAGWVHVFDALSVGLIEQWSRPDRMHGPDGSERQTDEEPDHPAIGLGESEPNARVDRDQQHQYGGDAFGHGVVLGGFEIEAQGALVAAGFGLERLGGQPLNLELTFVRRVLAPPAYTALVHAERGSDGGLGAVVADNIRGLHET